MLIEAFKRVYVLEVRLEGEVFDEPLVPFKLKVPGEEGLPVLRMFTGPRWLFDRAHKYGQVGLTGGVAIVDYMDPDPDRNIIIVREETIHPERFRSNYPLDHPARYGWCFSRRWVEVNIKRKEATKEASA